MEKRREELTKLKSYTKEIDIELTMILQNLQWDRKHLLQNPVMVTCRYDSNHKIPPDKSDEHEKECFLRQNGYANEDLFLPDPLDTDSSTLVKLSKADIEKVIGNAARSNTLFKKGVGCRDAEPMSLERLQTSYSADERRAIHDAVVSAVPACHDLTDLALLSGGDDQGSKVTVLSRTEILAELRNMRRRRTKYRVAAKTRNYSDVLRDVIRTQMEHYNEGQSETTTKETLDDCNIKETDNSGNCDNRDYRHERRGSDMRRSNKIEIKTEIKGSTERNRDYSREKLDRAYRYEDRAREIHDRDRNRLKYNERSRERRNNEDLDRGDRYAELSRKRRHDEGSELEYRVKERTRDKKDDSSKERRNYDNDSNRRERRLDKRSNGDKHRDSDLMYQVKREPDYDEDRNTLKERSRERRRDENTDKHHKRTNRTSDGKYDESHRRDRGRSRERKHKDSRYKDRSSERIYIKHEGEDSNASVSRTKDNRYKQRPGERINIKQEREVSATRVSSKRYKERPSKIIYIKQEREGSAIREESSRHVTYKSNDSRHKHYEGRNGRSCTTERSIEEEQYERYYDSTEAIYNPNKKIKVEK